MTTNYLKKAEQDTLAEILTWVQEVVEGRGESIAQMVVSVILGCIPYVGQAIDVYNILRALYQLTRNIDNADNWIELVLSLIALVPFFGDALKNVFRMLRNGKTMARILDTLPASVRGDIEKWFRKINWSVYTQELIGSVTKILDGLIDLFNTRVARWIFDKRGLQRLITQFTAIKTKARQKITEAMNSLQRAHQQAMAPPLPKTTAHVSFIPNTPVKMPKDSNARKPRRRTTSRHKGKSQSPKSINRNLSKNTGGNITRRQGQTSGQQRQSSKTQYKRHKVGVLGEHITDYYFVRNKKSRAKVNNYGVLYEGWQPGHHGIDHVWFSQSLTKKYRISDTKGTNEPFHKKLETALQVWQAIEYGFESQVGKEDEAKIRNSVGRTKSDGRQMSHLWVSRKIGTSRLVLSHAKLVLDIQKWARFDFDETLMSPVYDRSLITVVGPNFLLHDRNATKSSSATTISLAGKCRKLPSKHKIATEFVIPSKFMKK